MSARSFDDLRPVPPGNVGAGGASDNRGIDWPRVYDFILFVLTRGRDRAYRERLLDLAGVAPGTHVLDVGCGPGTQAIAAWHRTQPGGSVVGVDFSHAMIAAARRKARRAGLAVEFRQADAASLPFNAGRFDVVTVATVMHMLPEGRRHLAVQEAARVLRPGGRLLLVDYAGDPAGRKGFVARHGAHGRFDLHAWQGTVAAAGLRDIGEGPVGWLSVHFLRGTRE